MARLKLAYIGGGSTRAAGTMASFVQQGENFDGSEIGLIDLNEEHLRIVQTITQKMARGRGLDLTVTITTPWEPTGAENLPVNLPRSL